MAIDPKTLEQLKILPKTYELMVAVDKHMDDWQHNIEERNSFLNDFQKTVNANKAIVMQLEMQLTTDPNLGPRLQNFIRDNPAALSDILPVINDNPQQISELVEGLTVKKEETPEPQEVVQEAAQNQEPKSEPPQQKTEKEKEVETVVSEESQPEVSQEKPEPVQVMTSDQASVPESLKQKIDLNSAVQSSHMINSYLNLMGEAQSVGPQPEFIARTNLNRYLDKQDVDAVGASEFSVNHSRWAEKMAQEFLEDPAAQTRFEGLVEKVVNNEALNEHDTMAVQAGLLAHGYGHSDFVIGSTEHTAAAMSALWAGKKFDDGSIELGVNGENTLEAANRFMSDNKMEVVLNQAEPIIEIDYGFDPEAITVPTITERLGLNAEKTVSEPSPDTSPKQDIVSQNDEASSSSPISENKIEKTIKPEQKAVDTETAQPATPEAVIDPQLMEAQAYLRMFTWDTGGKVSVDGIDGPQTQKALKNYLNTNGLSEDLSIDAATNHMKARIIKGEPQISSEMINTMINDQSGVANSASDIRAVQQTLKLVGQDVSVTGQMDDKTRTAYQQYNESGPLRHLVEQKPQNNPAKQSLEKQPPKQPEIKAVEKTHEKGPQKMENKGVTMEPNVTDPQKPADGWEKKEIKVGEDSGLRHHEFSPAAKLVAGDDYNFKTGTGSVYNNGRYVGISNAGGIIINAPNPNHEVNQAAKQLERNLENEINKALPGVRVDLPSL